MFICYLIFYTFVTNLYEMAHLSNTVVMDPIRIDVSFDGDTMAPILEFVGETRRGSFTGGEPIETYDRIEEERVEMADICQIYYGLSY